CDEAIERGRPYARTGPSVFLHEANVLFDTPEEAKQQLTESRISKVDAAFYSHWHPDHTMGRRVWESHHECISFTIKDKTTVYIPENVKPSFEERLDNWGHLKYLESSGYIEVKVIKDRQPIVIGDYEITPIKLAEDYVSAFWIREEDKTTLLVMDEHMGWAPDVEFMSPDLAILPMGILTICPWTKRRLVPEDHPLMKFEASFQDTLELIQILKPGKVVLLHIEESAQISFEKGKELSEMTSNELNVRVDFAFDQMKIDF
ncbi:MAG: hypothetical protein KDD62_13315, partial [Bdellovibrionales bacterium]|nr:hypothetical protein [Bdellovibrionales bacterium]